MKMQNLTLNNNLNIYIEVDFFYSHFSMKCLNFVKSSGISCQRKEKCENNYSWAPTLKIQLFYPLNRKNYGKKN